MKRMNRKQLIMAKFALFMVFTILSFGINISPFDKFSSPNKHFVQVGMGKVWADYNGEPTFVQEMNGIKYTYKKFLRSGTFIIPSGVTTVDITVVGGGAAGSDGVFARGGGSAGGGGGGYVVNGYNVACAPGQAIPIVVAETSPPTEGPGTNYGQGYPSSYNGTQIVANGGTRTRTQDGGNGGSGGGGGTEWMTDIGGSGGSDGSDGKNGTNYRFNGVGGKGQYTTTRGIDGILYSGGGGGNGDTYGQGGAGGGGRGSSSSYNQEFKIAQSGTPNTGGGGGGGSTTWNVETPGAGGSGIVIIRWLNQAPTITVTSPSLNGAFSEVSGYNTISLQGTVSDPNAGDTITTKYNIDGGTTQTVAGTVTTSGSFTTTSINAGSLSEGNHTLNV